MIPEPIFSETFLKTYLADYRLLSVTAIDAKLKILRRWESEVKSRKLKNLKEEEVKSRFISDIFGIVLGFNLHNPINWQVGEENKVVVDATKPDASLGYFSLVDGRTGNEVRAVVEVQGLVVIWIKSRTGRICWLLQLSRLSSTQQNLAAIVNG